MGSRWMGTSGLVLWGLYVAFAVFAIATGLNDTTFQFHGTVGVIKAVIWIALLAFLAYSFTCSLRENFFRAVRSIATMWWGRQVGIDLYLGLLLSLFIIFLNDGLAVALLWLIPTLIYANLVILLYFALHIEAIATKLLALPLV